MKAPRAALGIIASLAFLSGTGCERKEKVLDVNVGGPEGGVKVEGFRSDDGSVELKVDEK